MLVECELRELVVCLWVVWVVGGSGGFLSFVVGGGFVLVVYVGGVFELSDVFLSLWV